MYDVVTHFNLQLYFLQTPNLFPLSLSHHASWKSIDFYLHVLQ